jgi:hypothetical protein
MTLDEISARAIGPALALLPATMDTSRARIMLLVTGLQESRFLYRRQIGGPARGFWQFEQGGGVYGAMRHQASRGYLEQLCARRVVPFEARAIWTAIEHDDVLAAGLARLLYWTDGKPLPSIGDASAAWDLYYRTWRPGKPHRQTWDAFYTEAVGFVVGGGS